MNNDSWGFKSLLATEFLGAFNDNAFKTVISLLVVNYCLHQNNAGWLLSLSGVLFVLPFLLFSAHAGYIADRFSKNRIMVAVKAMEVLIMCFAVYAFKTQQIPLVLSLLFLMGTHSAFFSPAKYGIMPQLLKDKELSQGNGYVQMVTYSAIILGQAFSGYLMGAFSTDLSKCAIIFMAISLWGLAASLMITPVPPTGMRRPFPLNPFKEIAQNINIIKTDKAIFLSIGGLMYFAFLGGLFQLNILLYARQSMGLDDLGASILLVVLAVGIGLGGMISGKVSDQKVELGLVPLGAMGLSIFATLLGINYHSLSTVIFCLMLLGISAGFYVVPLNSLIQHNSPQAMRGQVIATNNFLSFFAILSGSFSLAFLRDVVHLSAPQIFLLCGGLTIIGTVMACRILPYALVRLLVWSLTHTIYKIRSINLEHIPKEGGALLVCNHISFIDACYVVTSTHRPIRFLMDKEVYQWPPIHWLCRIANVIPISRIDSPKELLRSLNTARDALKNGELVCIFAEGQLTRTGNTLKFNKGLEHILKGIDVPVIPMHLDRIWGSVFSFSDGKFLSSWPKIIPYPVTVSVGMPLASTASAFEIRQKVMEIGSEAFQYRLEDKMTLAESFFVEARRRPFGFCVADSSAQKLNRAMTFILSHAIAKKLSISLPLFHHKRIRLGRSVEGQRGGQNIGILLPPSVAGVLTNVALGICHAVPVNINYTASKESIRSIYEQTDMTACITSRAFMEKAGISVEGEIIFIEDIIKSLNIFDFISSAFVVFAMPRSVAHRLIFKSWKNRDHQSLATIMFTSGSTGTPKGVMLTHANVTSNLEGLYQILKIHPNDKMLGILPFFHSFGFTGTLWFPLIGGLGAVYHYNPLEAKMVAKLVNDYKATLLMATPTFLSSYIRRCESEQMKSLRLVVVGAEKLKTSIAQAFKEKFGLYPMEGYGCTELSPIGCVNLPDFEFQGIVQKANKPGSIGLPLPGIALKIIDPQTGEPKGLRQEGLLFVKGPNVMKGYLNEPQKTREVVDNGWYNTGDIAFIDEDGFVTITDRLSRFSKIAGEMVPHIKIEEAIHHALHATEAMCAVTSRVDDKKGECLVVLYTGDLDIDALLNQIKSTGLPNLWIPEKSNFIKINALPLLGSGKIDLGAIKKIAAEMAG